MSALSSEEPLVKFWEELENAYASRCRLLDLMRVASEYEKKCGPTGATARAAAWEREFATHTVITDLCDTERQKGIRFKPQAGVVELSKEALEYFADRARKCKHPGLSALYADFVWTTAPRHYELGILAAKAYLDAVDLLTKQDNWIDATDALVRALEISVRLGDKSLVTTVEDKALTTAAQWIDAGQHRWVIDLGEAFVMCGRQSEKRQLEAMEAKIEQVEKVYASEKGEHAVLRRKNLEVLTRLKILLKRAPDSIKAVRMKVGESFEDEAQKRAADSKAVAAHLYRCALKVYTDVGADRDTLERVRSLVKHYSTEASKEMIHVKVEKELPPDYWDQLVKLLSRPTPEETVGMLACYISSLISANQVEPLMDTLRQSIAHQLFPVEVMHDYRRVGGSGIDDPEKSLRYEALHLVTQSLFQLLYGVLAKFFESGGLTQDQFKQVLASSALVPDRKKPFIERGLDYYLKEDYVAAIHVLVPHLEDVLRDVYEHLGKAPFGTRGGREDVILLDTILGEDSPVTMSLGMDLTQFMRFLLIEPAGLNIRNNLAHGLLSFDQCNWALATLVVGAFIMLSKYGYEESGQ